MNSILLGNSSKDGQPIRIPTSALDTHLHLIGGTGKGKTTGLHTILKPLMLDPFDNSSFLINDRRGGIAQELLLWMSSGFCTDRVRERLVYIEPSHADAVLSLNPLLHDSDSHSYFEVSRATDIVLRAWESVNIEVMPRLARWTFNSFWAAAQLGLTTSACAQFLMCDLRFGEDLLRYLPERLQLEWIEIIGSRSSETIRILESSRNRLKPFFEWDILRRIFGASENRFDAGRFVREGNIVVVNLQPSTRLSEQLADTTRALILNEVLTTPRSLPRGVRNSTHAVLDESQRFIGPDIETALPNVRQRELKVLLSHQSMSRLARGDYDPTVALRRIKLSNTPTSEKTSVGYRDDLKRKQAGRGWKTVERPHCFHASTRSLGQNRLVNGKWPRDLGAALWRNSSNTFCISSATRLVI